MALSPFDLIKKGAKGIIDKGKGYLTSPDYTTSGIIRNTITGIPREFSKGVSATENFLKRDSDEFKSTPRTVPVKTKDGRTINVPNLGGQLDDIPEPTLKEKITAAPKYATEIYTGIGMIGDWGLSKLPGYQRATQYVQRKTGDLLPDTFDKLLKYQIPTSQGEFTAMEFFDVADLPFGGTLKGTKAASKFISKTDDTKKIFNKLTGVGIDEKKAVDLAEDFKNVDNERYIDTVINDTITEQFVSKDPSTLIKQLKDRTKEFEDISTKAGRPQDAKATGMKTSSIVRAIEGNPTKLELDKAKKYLDSNYVGKRVIADGKQGVVRGTSYGKVRVAFEDGITRAIDSALVKPVTKADPIQYLRNKGIRDAIGQIKIGGKIDNLVDNKIGKIDDATLSNIEYNNEIIASLKAEIKNHPGAKLKKFMSKKEGEFLDFKDPLKAGSRDEAIKITQRNRKVADIIANSGRKVDMNDPDVVRDLIDEYDNLKAEVKQIQDQTKELKTVKPQKAKPVGPSEADSLARSAETAGYNINRTDVKNIQRVNRAREAKVKAYKEALNLSDKDLNKIKGQRDFRNMTEAEFDNFLKELDGRGRSLQETSKQRAITKGIIESKELSKTENARRMLKLPSISNMSAKQLKQFGEYLEEFKTGDEFLSVRQLETVKNTNLENVKTYREALEALAKETGVKVEDLNNIKVKGIDKILYDFSLANRSVFHKQMVKEVHSALLNAEGRFLEKKQLINKLTKEARKSRKRSVADILAPTDKNVFNWLESDDAGKAKLSKEMTPEEMKLAETLKEMFEEARDYLVQSEVLKQFKNNYITNVRRGFLEAWKTDGIMSSLKEIFTSNKLDEAKFAVKDPKTGQILALEKFFKFSIRRGNKIKPTENVADAALAYFSTLERKIAFDRVIPKIDIYAAALEPKNISKAGMNSHQELRAFTKEWLNTKKGNVSRWITTPGSKADWVLRTGIAATRLIDLGFSIPIGAASFVGEGIVNTINLGFKKVAIGNSRLYNPFTRKQAKAILKANEAFVGESVLVKLRDQSKGFGDKFLTSAFSLFNESARRANKEFLLGSLTKQEFKTGKISAERLAEIQQQMGRWRVTEGANSILGATAGGKAITQYKTWAVPILQTTVDDSKKILKILRNEKSIKVLVKSKEFQELFRGFVLTSFLGYAMYNYANAADDKRPQDKTLLDKFIEKSAREAMTFFQALGPTLWLGVPRVLTFVEALGDMTWMLITHEENKSGESKGIKKAKQTLVPSGIKQFIPSEKPKTRGDLRKEVKEKLESGEFGSNAVAAEYIKEELAKIYSREKAARLKLPMEEFKAELRKGLENETITKKQAATEIKAYTKDPAKTDRTTKYVEERGPVGLVLDYGKALTIDPGNVWKALGPNEKLGIVEGNLVEMQRFQLKDYKEEGGSNEYKRKAMAELGIPWSKADEYNLEHIVPVKAGGDTSANNLKIVPRKEHNSYTDWDIAASKAVQNNKMTRKEITEIAIRLKIDKEITVEEALELLKTE